MVIVKFANMSVHRGPLFIQFLLGREANKYLPGFPILLVQAPRSTAITDWSSVCVMWCLCVNNVQDSNMNLCVTCFTASQKGLLYSIKWLRKHLYNCTYIWEVFTALHASIFIIIDHDFTCAKWVLMPVSRVAINSKDPNCSFSDSDGVHRLPCWDISPCKP